MSVYNLYGNRWFLAIILAAILLIAACQPANNDSSGSPVTLATVLQNNLKASREGGQAGGVLNMHTVVSIEEGGSTVVGRYRATTEGLMRIDVFADGERVYSEGTDADGAWEWPGGEEGPANVYHEGANALNRGIEMNLFTLAEYAGRGHQVELLGEETIDDQLHYVLKVTLSDGFEHFRYINADNWQVEKTRDHRSLHPAIDPTQKDFESRFSEWKTVDGVSYASSQLTIDRTSNEVIQKMQVREAAYNVSADELDLERSYIPTSSP